MSLEGGPVPNGFSRDLIVWPDQTLALEELACLSVSLLSISSIGEACSGFGCLGFFFSSGPLSPH